MKDCTCIINLGMYKSTGTHWIVLYVNGNNITWFDSFGVKFIQKEIRKLIGNKNIKYTTKSNKWFHDVWVLFS